MWLYTEPSDACQALISQQSGQASTSGAPVLNRGCFPVDGLARADHARGSLWPLIFSRRKRSKQIVGCGLKPRRSRHSGERACFGFGFGSSAEEATITFIASIGPDRKLSNEGLKKSPGSRSMDAVTSARGTINSHLDPSREKNVRRAEKTSQPGPLDSSKSLVPPAPLHLYNPAERCYFLYRECCKSSAKISVSEARRKFW